jgi:hypothetical protein
MNIFTITGTATTTTRPATTATITNNNNGIETILAYVFFRFSDGEGKHRWPTMEHRLILALISKQNVLITGCPT